ncbi:MAG: rRNA pseudouridine synthase [Dysgonamonadaceae bacterium]|jgi:23S rRNA pseudouridine2605 synthase|nr:rRNA pseudouridine synthase [Dysgonamonadaceae bacterium]
MATENEEWTPRNRYGDHNREADDQNRPRRPYQPNNRPSYGDQTGHYHRQEDSSDRPKPLKKRRLHVGEMPVYGRKPIYNSNRQRGDSGYENPRSGSYPQKFQRQGNRPNTRPERGYNREAGIGSYKTEEKTNHLYKYREEHYDPNELIRLNKYMANAGICSRREADEYITAGLVKVNGKTITELGTKVKRADEVIFHDSLVKMEQKIYVLLNKPKGCVTTTDDPEARLTVMDLVKTACRERIFPVGRLDRSTTGVLLLTNDGELSSKLTHPRYSKKKIYHVWLNKDVSVADMQKLADGVTLEDGEIHADAISYVNETANDQVGIEIHSGKNRVIRRMFEALGYHVIKLDRVYFAGLTKKNLKRGHWRYLNDKEVSKLRMGAFD